MYLSLCLSLQNTFHQGGIRAIQTTKLITTGLKDIKFDINKYQHRWECVCVCFLISKVYASNELTT